MGQLLGPSELQRLLVFSSLFNSEVLHLRFLQMEHVLLLLVGTSHHESGSPVENSF